MEVSKTGKKADKKTLEKVISRKRRKIITLNFCRNTTSLFLPEYGITTHRSERKYVD
jgi:hypothetical protein